MGSSGKLTLRVISQSMVACGKLVLGLRAQKSLLRPLLVVVHFLPDHRLSVGVE